MLERPCDADPSTGPAGEVRGRVGFLPPTMLFFLQSSTLHLYWWAVRFFFFFVKQPMHMPAVKIHSHKDVFEGLGFCVNTVWNNRGEVIDGNHLVAPSCLGCKMNRFCIYTILEI